MNDILSFVRPDLKTFKGYSSAANEAGHLANPSIKINANESSVPPFGAIGEICSVNRYAEPQPARLKDRLASYWQLNPEKILLTAGSDQGIDTLVRTFCSAGKDSILICSPTFSMYEVSAALQGAHVLDVPLKDDGQLNLPEIEKTLDPSVKLVFIPSPNAPMGQVMREDDLLSLAEKIGAQSLLVVDEAYVEFSDNPAGLIAYLNKIPNLVLLRTLSKAQALAGERLGCVLAPEPLIKFLQKILPSYPLAQSSVQAALDALSPVGIMMMKQRIETTKKERARLFEKLALSPEIICVSPSQGNFLFVQTTNAESFLSNLARFGILARNMNKVKENAVRLSICTIKENDLLLSCLGLLDEPLRTANRIGKKQRKTKETMIDVALNLDESSPVFIKTGIGFFDHMLAQIATHGGFALTLIAEGDLHIDNHHTIEDCALALGAALNEALGDKKGLARFAFTAPLDESVARVVLDLSGRPFAEVKLNGPAVFSEGMDYHLAEHFFSSFATSLGATLHINSQGSGAHHVLEAAFKALGRALRDAIRIDGDELPSTKGVL